MKNLNVLLALTSIVGLLGLSSCASTCKDKACTSCCSSGGAKKECCVKAGGECKACASKKAADKKN